ncbi:MAG: hypothetical protein AAFR61_20225 [Bacteroidota bacterium]
MQAILIPHRHFLWIHVGLPMLGGSMVYLLFRAYWDLSLLSFLPEGNSAAGAWLPHWVRFQLPDGLWLYSALRFQQWVWQGASLRKCWGWFLLPIGLAFGSEGLQLMGWLRGTGDWGDMLWYLAAVLVGLGTYFPTSHKKLYPTHRST